MSERDGRKIEIVDMNKVGVDHPIIQDYYAMLFNVASKVQLISNAWEAAGRVLGVIENQGSPSELDQGDLQTVFESADCYFEEETLL